MELGLILAAALAAVLLPGTLELLLVTAGSVLPNRRMHAKPTDVGMLAVVVPAHNESALIRRTAASIRRSMEASGRPAMLVVVADNCSDDTAGQAETLARVLVRHDPSRRGKGHALRFAFDALMAEGVDRFAIVDADSDVSENFVAVVSAWFDRGASAIQVPYLVRNANESWRTRLLGLALTAFNYLRPLGRERWGLSTGIYGNGFALSRQCLGRVPYEAFSIVEDLEYHLHLVRSNIRVRFAAEATVWGDMPAAGGGVATQRSRWEGGRLLAARRYVPVLFREALGGEHRLWEPLLDLLCLPLALHTLLLTILAGTAWMTGSLFWIAVAAAFAIVLALHVARAFAATPSPLRTLAALAAAPVYVLWKLTMVPVTLRHGSTKTAWVRTQRES